MHDIRQRNAPNFLQFEKRVLTCAQINIRKQSPAHAIVVIYLLYGAYLYLPAVNLLLKISRFIRSFRVTVPYFNKRIIAEKVRIVWASRFKPKEETMKFGFACNR